MPVPEPKSFSVQIDADPRFAAAVGGAARYVGESAGLQPGASEQLQGAVAAACAEAFEHLTAQHPHLTVTFTRHDDRIEIALSHDGGSRPAIGLDTLAAGAASIEGIDRMQYESRGERAVTVLTKYLKQSTSRLAGT